MRLYRVHAYDDEHYATLVIQAERPEEAASAIRANPSAASRAHGWPGPDQPTAGAGCRGPTAQRPTSRLDALNIEPALATLKREVSKSE